MKNNNSGFSLVELIVVIAIMAVLVALLAPQFLKYVDKTRMSTDIQNVQNVCRVIEVYSADDHYLAEDYVATFVLSCDNPVYSSDSYLQEVFSNQEVDSCKLKSHSWFSSSNSSKTITITVTDLGLGMPKFTEDPSEFEGSYSIVNGITH